MSTAKIDLDNFERNAVDVLSARRAEREQRARLTAGMLPIPDRYDMAHFAQEYFYQTGRAAEIGVFEGHFSAHNLRTWQGDYLMVDTWAHRPGDGQDKNDENADYWDVVRKTAEAHTAFARTRREIYRGYSAEIAGIMPDESFDWVYLDAGHDYQNAKADIEAWWPKVRPGGLFSGDDYGIGFDAPGMWPLTAERFEKRFGEIANVYKWGTALALKEFCEQRGIVLRVTWLNDFANPAWYIVKPYSPDVQQRRNQAAADFAGGFLHCISEIEKRYPGTALDKTSMLSDLHEYIDKWKG